MLFGWFKKKQTREQTPAAIVATPSPAPAPTNNASAAVQTERPTAPVVAIEIPRDKIVARAYEIWVRKGKPHGKDFENWVEAEAELRAELAAISNAEPLPRKPR